MNYWQNFSECEKRIYKLITKMEKEITHDALFTIITANFDLASKPKIPGESYFFHT
jgi:hypothetical protein